MNKLTTSTALPTRELKLEVIANMSASFELLAWLPAWKRLAR